MISVVIPAFNEGEYLARCLQSLLNQDYRKDFEIIVVDNGSTDDTSAVAHRFGARVVPELRRGISWARQKGFNAARGEIIASTDADTILPTGWLTQIESLFDSHSDAVVVAGHYVLIDGPVVARVFLRLIFMLLPFASKFLPDIWSFPGSNFAVKADAVRAVGGFDTTTRLYDDIDLCRRLRKVGRVIYSSEITVQTSGRSYGDDPLAIKHILNYLSQIFVGKQVPPDILGTAVQNNTKD